MHYVLAGELAGTDCVLAADVAGSTVCGCVLAHGVDRSGWLAGEYAHAYTHSRLGSSSIKHDHESWHNKGALHVL